VLLLTPFAVSTLAGLERNPPERGSLTPGLVEAVRSQVRPGEVIVAPELTSLRLLAAAPVFVVAAPPGHIALTRENRPRARARQVVRFFRGELAGAERRAFLARYGVDWLVVDRSRPYPADLVATLRPSYEDGRFALYRLATG
jgi:hypothetical protein